MRAPPNALITAVVVPFVLIACSDDGPADAPPDVPEVALGDVPTLSCQIVPNPSGEAFQVHSTLNLADTGFIVHDAGARTVDFFAFDHADTDQLLLTRRIEFDEAGPRGVAAPRGIALEGDSLLWIADRAAPGLRWFDLTSDSTGFVPLSMPPEAIVAGTGPPILLTSPTPTQSWPPLVYMVDSDLEAVGPDADDLMIEGADWRLAALNSMLLLSELPDGQVVAAHRFLTPRIHSFRRGEDAEVRTRSLPIPEDLSGRLEALPSYPFEEGELDAALHPALWMTVDHAAAELVILARGRESESGLTGTALHWIGADLTHIRSARAPRPLRALLFTGEDQLWVVDELEQWHRCRVGAEG